MVCAYTYCVRHGKCHNLVLRPSHDIATPQRQMCQQCVLCLTLRLGFRETTSLKLAKLRGCTFVNQYVVIKYLGRGACGRVFLCMDMTDNRLYAVKVCTGRMFLMV